MCTYSLEDITVLDQTINTFFPDDYGSHLRERINGLIEEKMSETDMSFEEIIKRIIVEHLCCGIINYVITYKKFREHGIEELICEVPFEELPLYINGTGDDILKSLVADWRLKIGK